MIEKKKRLCFVSSDPEIEGGMTNYLKNLIKYIQSKNKNIELIWIYKSYENKDYIKEHVRYIGLKTKNIKFIDDFLFNKKVKIFLEENYFEIINSHAIYGYWMDKYKKEKNQKLINTYHGSAFPYYRIHLKRFNLIKKILLSPLLIYSYLIEKPPIKKADKIICVSEKVKKQIENIYFKRGNIFIIRTGVNLTEFKTRDKNTLRDKFGLDKNNIYGLHVAKGGYWIKGLDRAVKLSEELYNLDKRYRLIVIGPNYEKNKIFLDKKFIIHIEKIPRKSISLYYSASDIFFCLSRYEGGAPTLVTSEAMASGCLVICSKDSEQEIIEDNKNGIILTSFNEKDAKRIMDIIQDIKKQKEIIKQSIKTIKSISLEKWGEEYTKIITR